MYLLFVDDLTLLGHFLCQLMIQRELEVFLVAVPFHDMIMLVRILLKGHLSFQMALDEVLLIALSLEFLFKKGVSLLRPKVRLVILLLPVFELPLLCLCDVDLLLDKLEVTPMVMEL